MLSIMLKYRLRVANRLSQLGYEPENAHQQYLRFYNQPSVQSSTDSLSPMSLSSPDQSLSSGQSSGQSSIRPQFQSTPDCYEHICYMGLISPPESSAQSGSAYPEFWNSRRFPVSTRSPQPKRMEISVNHRNRYR